jgi:hypothetical protein
MKDLILTTSKVIGINLWFAPQISEHWPKNRPVILGKKLIWLSRPGTASTLTPIEGRAQEWSTSDAEIKLRTCEFTGTKVWLSVSRRRGLSILYGSM